MEYLEAYTRESLSLHGNFGLKILLSIPRELTDSDKRMLNRIGDEIAEAIERETNLNDQTLIVARREMVAELAGLFPERIFVQEIPNQYCSQACCVHRPWLVVTTPVGPIIIGWRKRVIFINWADSQVKATAEDLFPTEDVTKGLHIIHAWGYEKARQYIGVILARNPLTTV